jgi:hypothetical protein
MCGHAAWILTAPMESVEVESSLTADYSPWNTAFFPGLDPDILIEALRDRQGGTWLSPRQVMDCFLLNPACEVTEVEQKTTPATQVRIANDKEPDFDRPDGFSFELAPGTSVLLDLRDFPILIDDSYDTAADVLILFIGDDGPSKFIDALRVEFALRPEGEWFPIALGGDQIHTDSGLEITYSDEALAAQGNGVSSEDVLAQDTWGVALNLNELLTQTGLYGWMRLGLSEAAQESLQIDAIIVLDAQD